MKSRKLLPDFPADLQAQVPSTSGKVTHINFWTYSCEPCLREMPLLEVLYREVDLSPLLINFDRSAEQQGMARVFAADLELGEIRYWGEHFDRINEGWSLQVWPQHYLVDKQGRVALYYWGSLEGELKRFKDLALELLAEGSSPQ